MGNVYGYVRVSSADQNVDRQVIAMRARGIPDRRIIIDKASGKDFNRPKYRNMVRRLKKGDTLYIHSLDRLGRSYAEVPLEWNRLSRRKGVTIKVLDMEMLDTDRPLGRIESFLMQIVLMLMSFLAEDERLRTRKRQAEGIAAARARGNGVKGVRGGLVREVCGCILCIQMHLNFAKLLILQNQDVPFHAVNSGSNPLGDATKEIRQLR